MFGEIKKRTIVAIGVLIFLNQSSVLARNQTSTKQWHSFTLSFGKDSGRVRIPQKKIDRFIHNVVIPRIDGFKIIETQGVWKGQTEASFDLVVLSNEFNITMKKLKKIGFCYKKTFSQKSVLFYYVKAIVSFL